ncbi:pth, partial [Symbiodinium sp. KB8]
GRQEGLLLDLAVFTDPPQPYQVWRTRPLEVCNKNEGELEGHLAIAGYTKALWELPREMLPPTPAAKHGKVIAGFYQVHKDSVEPLEVFLRYLTDPNSRPCPLAHPPRRRVVILLEVERPNFLFRDVDRFRKRKTAAAGAARGAEAGLVASDSVPAGEAVFQWWWGDPNPGGVGHWKNYHPHVSARLEELARNENFRTCKEPVPIDEVRYSLQRISFDAPFDFSGEQRRGVVFREPFLPTSRVTVEDAHFDDETRLSNNCFVQFQKGNPRRRRPVRRVRRGEVAGLDLKTGKACSICFSDDGFLIGCGAEHLVCNSCRWRALRAVVGDVTQTEKLVCGCLTLDDTTAFSGLAEAADKSMQALVAAPPKDPVELQEFEMELAQVRRQFQVREVPVDIFRRKAKLCSALTVSLPFGRSSLRSHESPKRHGCMTLLWKAGWILSLSLRASAATMSCKLAVVARKDLGMSAGKLAAQVGHAVHDTVTECDPKKLDAWEEDGSMIVVLEANSEEELKGLEAMAKRQGLQVAPITDEGLTEVEDETWTVLAIGPDASKKVDTVTGKLSLYRDEAAELREKLK